MFSYIAHEKHYYRTYVVIALVVVTSSGVRGLGVGGCGVSAIGSNNSQQGSEN